MSYNLLLTVQILNVRLAWTQRRIRRELHRDAVRSKMEAPPTRILATFLACFQCEIHSFAGTLCAAVSAQAAGGSVEVVRTHTIVSRPHARAVLCVLTTLSSTFMATIVKVVYGLELAETDPEAARIEKMLEGLQALTPGKYLVEFLPFLQHVPGWVPGTGFQRELGAWRDATVGTKEGLFKKAMEGIVSEWYPNMRNDRLTHGVDEDKGIQTRSVVGELVEGRGVDVQDENDPTVQEIPKSVGNVAVEGASKRAQRFLIRAH